MVLKLKDICLNFIAKNFTDISNFNHKLLSSAQKEIIIERLANHNWLSTLSIDIQSIESYQKSLIQYFFNGCLNAVIFNDCYQLDDNFIELITQLVSSNELVIKSIAIIRCYKLTGIKINIFFLQYYCEFPLISKLYLYISKIRQRNKQISVKIFDKYTRNQVMLF